ncbi:MAG: hypothetical protein K6G83_05635 [Lachnospiraceae bacterium]|nr:hypothetical protein [Lachnospiraceae bacterium]
MNWKIIWIHENMTGFFYLHKHGCVDRQGGTGFAGIPYRKGIIDEMMVTVHGKSVGQESDGDESN